MSIEKMGMPTPKKDVSNEIGEGIHDYLSGDDEHTYILRDYRLAEYKSNIEGENGVEIEKKPLTAGQEIGNLLANKCIPDGEFTDIESFYEAMLKKVENYNAVETNWSIAAWGYNEKNKSLHHETGTGRMDITLKDNFFCANLYTPDYIDGEQPFYSITLFNGKLNACLFEPDVLGKNDRLDRLFHVNRYFMKIFGIENILNASDNMTKEYTIASLRSYLQLDIQDLNEEIAEFNKRIEAKNNPENTDASSTEELHQFVQEREERRQAVEEQLKKLNEYEVKLNQE